MSSLVGPKWSNDSSGVPAKVPSAKQGPQQQKGNRTKPFDLEGGIHYKTVHQHRVRGSSAPFRGLKPAFWPVGWADQSFYPACPHIGSPPWPRLEKSFMCASFPPITWNVSGRGYRVALVREKLLLLRWCRTWTCTTLRRMCGWGKALTFATGALGAPRELWLKEANLLVGGYNVHAIPALQLLAHSQLWRENERNMVQWEKGLHLDSTHS